MNIRSVSGVIEASPQVTVHFSQYSNSSLLVIGQVNKLGIFILAQNENPEAQDEEKVYNVEVKFGDRCDEWSITLARAIVERLNQGNMMIILSVLQKDREMFRNILDNLEKIIG